jgi:F420-dependent oxidoreductase-like protein
MDLGLNIGYWGLGLTAEDQKMLVTEAEKLDYSTVWAAEAYGSDAATVLAWLAANTTRIGLGSAIFQIPARTAAMTAMTAATLDQISGGRFRLGLGPSGPQVSEGWHGVRFARQLMRTREYIDVVRMALRRERVEYHGESIDLPLPDGPGKSLKLTISPVQDRIPIYLAAIGPKNTALAAEIADGWMPMFLAPEHFGIFQKSLDEGFAKRTEPLEGFDFAANISALVTDDIESARDAMRPIMALYVGGMGSRDKNFYNALITSYGFTEAAKEVQDLYLDGKKEEAAAALPADLIDMVSLCGTKDHVLDRMRAFKAAGITSMNITPMAFDPQSRIEQMRLLAEIRDQI